MTMMTPYGVIGWEIARAHRAAGGGERACNCVDGIVLIVTKFRPYSLRVSVYYYVYPQILRARILFLVTFSTSPSMLLVLGVACPLAAFGASMRLDAPLISPYVTVMCARELVTLYVVS